MSLKMPFCQTARSAAVTRLLPTALAMLGLTFGTLTVQAGPTGFQQCGKASWYKLGGTTASGERADPSGMTAAHRTLPFGTLVDVTNLSNGKTVTVRINDRGPFARGRVIDVTLQAAKELDFVGKGITRVRVSTDMPAKKASHSQNCQ